MENPIKVDDLEVPLLLDATIFTIVPRDPITLLEDEQAKYVGSITILRR